MEKIKSKNIQIALLAGVVILIVDIFSKYWVANSLCGSATILRDRLYFSPQINTGIAFGIHLPMWFQVMASLIVLAILIQISRDLIFARRKRNFLKSILFGIIIGGAVGNLINRIFQGYVIDFIVLKPFPIFNIADVGVTVGLIALFFASLIQPD